MSLNKIQGRLALITGASGGYALKLTIEAQQMSRKILTVIL